MFVAQAASGYPARGGRTLPVSFRLPARSRRAFVTGRDRSVPVLVELSRQMGPGSRILFGLWLLLMVLIPHILRLADRPVFLGALSLAIVVQASLVFSLLLPALRVKATLTSLLWVLAIAWLAEFIGHSTGLPFGRYTYSEVLRPQIGGVPIQIPAAWLMMLPPAWAAGTAVCGKGLPTDSASRWKQRASLSLVSGLAFTAWDLFLDPQMVAWGVWQWETPGPYFGVPAINFIGWVLIAFLALSGLSYTCDSDAVPREALLLVYTTVWLLNSLGLGLFFDQPGAAAAGFAGMGFFVVLAWRQVLSAGQ